MTELTGWGRYPRRSSTLVEARDAGALARLFAPDAGAVLRGAGRAYGDAAIGERLTVDARPLDRFIAFDRAAGRLSVEAGVMLADVLEACVPRGYFPPVVPGTKFVTIGGMIAADVHGKNHHRDGGFGAHVEELTLLTPTGERVTCSPTRNAELFEATVGGMGLTGAILDATFRLRPIETGWMRQTTHVAGDLDAALALLERTDESTYVVAWIDCLACGASLGRSLIFAAEHATRAEIEQMKPGAPSYPRVRGGRLAAPFDLPSFALSRPTVSAFNEVYFRAGARKAGAPFLVSWDPYFFPLDSISGWNRMYGRRGFVQHQCVLPKDRARDVLAETLERVSRRGVAS
ncbi:MAG TPA: FAD-binding oxidoreductase, partial [Beijerinckiaceae bacterium]